MKRLATLLSVALLGALAGASGCVENRASVQLQAICVPTDDCTFADTCDAQYIGYPTLDVSTSPAGVLWLLVQVGNQLPNNEDLDVGRTNTNDAHVDETYVEFEGARGGTASVGSNYLVPAEGTAVISVQLDLSTAIVPAGGTAEVLAHVRLRGYFDDGSRFESGDFPVLVRVCDGCVGTFGCAVCPPDSDGQLPATCIQ